MLTDRFEWQEKREFLRNFGFIKNIANAFFIVKLKYNYLLCKCNRDLVFCLLYLFCILNFLLIDLSSKTTLYANLNFLVLS